MKFPLLAALFLTILFTNPSLAFPQDASEEGSFYFRRGEEYYRKMEYAKALREYERAIQVEPQNEVFFKAIVDLCERFNQKEEKWRRMALFYRNAQEYDKALFFYQKILSVYKQDTEVLNSIGNITNWRKDYKTAVDYFNRSLKVKESADAFWGRGDAYFFQGLLDPAQAEYKRALSLEPAHMLAHRRLGQIHEKRGEYEEALLEYKRVLKNKANDADVWIKVGSIYEIGRDFPNARLSYTKAAEFDPENPDALNGLGRACVALGEYDEAEKCFKDAMHASRGAGTIDSLNGLGWLYAWKGDERKAEGYFYRAMGEAGFNREAATGLGWIHSRSEEYAKALEWYEKAKGEKAGSFDVASRIGMAWVYTRQEQYDRAIELYKEILKENPGSIEATNGLGWLYLKIGDPESARRFYEKSLSLMERNPDAHYGIAQILEKELRFDEAIRHYKTALGYGPLNLPYKKALAICYLKSQEYDKALELLAELVERDARDEDIWGRFASLCVQSGRLEDAAEAYRHILAEINPNSLEAAAGLAEIYSVKADYDRAGRMYEKILEIDPNDRVARRGLAVSYKERGLYDKALKEFEWLIAAKQNDVEGWNNLGWLYLRLQDYPKAVESYEKGLSFSPDNPDGLVGLSYVHLEMIRRAASKSEREDLFQKAAGNCWKIAELRPFYKDAFLCLSRLYEEMGDKRKAEEVLTAGLRNLDNLEKEKPGDRVALEEALELRRALFSLESKEKAGGGFRAEDVDALAREYDRLLASKINDPGAWLGLASLYRAAKRYDEAQEVLEKAIQYAGEDEAGEVKLALAELFLLRNDPERAERLYVALLESGSADGPRIRFGMGRVHELRGDSSGAIRLYERAVRGRWKDSGADYKEARLVWARGLAKRGFLSKALKVYSAGLERKPLDEEYNLKTHRETGEIYLKVGFLARAERSYRRCLEIKPDDFDAQVALAHIARFRGDYWQAARRYEESLARDPGNADLHRILGSVRFWTRDWRKADEEYRLALESPNLKDRNGVEEDLAKLKKASASSFTPRFKYSQSKEDDTGKKDFITKTTAWDSGFHYRHVVDSRLSLDGAFSYSSTEEQNLKSAVTNFDINSDFETVGFEAHPVEDVEITGSYNATGYRRNGDASGQRTPLRKAQEFHGYDIGLKYSPDRSFVSLKSSKEPLRVKVFGDDPELDFYSKYNVSLGLGGYLGDVTRIEGTYGANYYSPSDVLKQLYRADLSWNLYKHTLGLFAKKEDLPFTSFLRADGLRVLGVQSAGFSYANNWIEHVTLKAGFEKRYYSDTNRADAVEASAVYAAPFLEGLNFGYGFNFQDYRFRAGAIGGEPTYRSPQDLGIHSLSVSYEADILDKLKGSAGYSFSMSSEDKTGHSAFLKTSFDVNEGATLNLEVEANDDASFAKEQKYLVYLTKRFF